MPEKSNIPTEAEVDELYRYLMEKYPVVFRKYIKTIYDTQFDPPDYSIPEKDRMNYYAGKNPELAVIFSEFFRLYSDTRGLLYSGEMHGALNSKIRKGEYNDA